jgi:hypothetical protein
MRTGVTSPAVKRSGREVEVHPHLALKLRMGGAMHLLLYVLSCCGRKLLPFTRDDMYPDCILILLTVHLLMLLGK